MHNRPLSIAVLAVLLLVCSHATAQIYLSDHLGVTGCTATASNPPYMTIVGGAQYGIGRDTPGNWNCEPIAFRRRGVFQRGLGAAPSQFAPTVIEFDLDAIRQTTSQRLDVFEATAGINHDGSVNGARFEVYLDGALRASEDVASVDDDAKTIRLPVSKTHVLLLVTTRLGNWNRNHAAWGDCKLSAADSQVLFWGEGSFGQGEVPALPAVVELSAGNLHTVARRSDGSVVAWGHNTFGESDVPALPAGLSYVEIAAGGYHTMARRSDGSVVAWGRNDAGQINVPALPSGVTYVEIDCRSYYSLARRSDGSLVFWGWNNAGQGNLPTLPPGLAYVEIAAGVAHCLALHSDGTIVGWGGNFWGQVSAPALPAGVTYVGIAAGHYHSVACRSDGSVVAWGDNVNGQTNVPALPSGVTYVDVACGAHHALARRSDGTVVAWGWNGFGQTDVPALPAGLTYVEIAACEYNSVARRSDGAVVAWGSNQYGQTDVPADLLPSFTEVEAGGLHALCLLSDGTVAAWGANQYGQTDVPALPPGLAYVETVGGYFHSLARRSDGSVVAWGDNQHGQINVPSLPPGMTYVEISAGSHFSLARRSDGAVLAWGESGWGQLNVPALPAGLAYTQIAGGGIHAAALRSDGSVVAWGDNQYGQTNVRQLPPGLCYVEIAAGAHFCLARRSDGSVVGWGRNDQGQTNVPPPPPGLTYVAIAAGDNHCLAQCSDGSVTAWGFGLYGQTTVPTPAPGLSAVEIRASGYYSLARYAPRSGHVLPVQGKGELSNGATGWFSGSGSVHQAIYESSHFAANGQPTPITIDRLQWRLAGGAINVEQTWPQVDLRLGYSARDFSTPSTTFATNRTASHTLVYSGPVTSTVASGARPNDWILEVEFTTPFVYDPGREQDLLVELALTGAPTPAGAPTLACAFVGQHYGCRAVQSTISSTATTGALSSIVPIVQLGYQPVSAPARHGSYGVGCYDRRLSFYEIFAGDYPRSSHDLTGKTVRLVPNANGGYDVTTTLGVSLVAPAINAGLALPDDGPSAALNLGFTFPYPGGHSTTQVWAHSNGSVTLNGPGMQYMNDGGTPFYLLQNTRHLLSPSLQDLLCDGATNVQNVYAEPGAPGEYLITWWDVPPYQAVPSANPGLSRFQVALFDTGVVEFRYEALFNESDTYGGGMLVGFSLGGGALDPGASDLTCGVLSTAGPEGQGLVLRATGRPVLGQPIQYVLENVYFPAAVSTILLSFQQVNPGLPLTGIGVAAPGCDYHISPFANLALSPLLFGAPTVSYSRTWPASTAYAGTRVYLQAFNLAPGLNPVGVISSNGLAVVLDVN